MSQTKCLSPHCNYRFNGHFSTGDVHKEMLIPVKLLKTAKLVLSFRLKTQREATKPTTSIEHNISGFNAALAAVCELGHYIGMVGHTDTNTHTERHRETQTHSQTNTQKNTRTNRERKIKAKSQTKRHINKARRLTKVEINTITQKQIHIDRNTLSHTHSTHISHTKHHKKAIRYYIPRRC